MGLSRSILLLSLLTLLIGIYWALNFVPQQKNVKSFSFHEEYFGQTLPLSKNDEDRTIRSFTVPFDRSQVDDVINRLSKTRFSPTEITIDHRHVNRSTYGFPRQTAEMIREYWINTYDWKKTVRELNEFQHYQTQIQVRIFVFFSLSEEITDEFRFFRV